MSQAVIVIPAGADYHQPLILQNAVGTAVNLASATNLKCYVFRGQTLLTTLTTTSGITSTDLTIGSIQLDFADTLTDNASGEYTFEVWCTLGGDEVFLGSGKVVIVPTYPGVT